jgi:hypothetical protein
MDEFILKDYASWKLENYEILETFKKGDNPVYERLEPVYVVVEHIYHMVCEGEEVDDDLDNIFNIGFSYLHSQINVIKIYFENLFKSNCEEFLEYSEMILFLMFIYDLRTDLDAHGFDSEIDIVNHVETYIEDMIMERRQDFMYVREQMSKMLKEVYDLIDYEYVSVIDIYFEIAENLGIYLYEDDDVIIGNDI